jgi:hypothetical protein
VGRALRALEEAIIDGDIPANDPAAAREWLGRHPELLRDD